MVPQADALGPIRPDRLGITGRVSRLARDVGEHQPIVGDEKDHAETEIPERERIEEAS